MILHPIKILIPYQFTELLLDTGVIATYGTPLTCSLVSQMLPTYTNQRFFQLAK